MEAIDANDNGIEIADACATRRARRCRSRVARLNKRWNAPRRRAVGGRALFEGVGAVRRRVRRRARVHRRGASCPRAHRRGGAARARQATHASGEVIVCRTGGCPWKTHLYELERRMGVTRPLVKFVLYEDSGGHVARAGGDRRGHRLHQPPRPARGRGAACATRSRQAAAIDGCKFVHATASSAATPPATLLSRWRSRPSRVCQVSSCPRHVFIGQRHATYRCLSRGLSLTIGLASKAAAPAARRPATGRRSRGWGREGWRVRTSSSLVVSSFEFKIDGERAVMYVALRPRAQSATRAAAAAARAATCRRPWRP